MYFCGNIFPSFHEIYFVCLQYYCATACRFWLSGQNQQLETSPRLSSSLRNGFCAHKVLIRLCSDWLGYVPSTTTGFVSMFLSLLKFRYAFNVMTTHKKYKASCVGLYIFATLIAFASVTEFLSGLLVLIWTADHQGWLRCKM